MKMEKYTFTQTGYFWFCWKRVTAVSDTVFSTLRGYAPDLFRHALNFRVAGVMLFYYIFPFKMNQLRISLFVSRLTFFDSLIFLITF